MANHQVLLQGGNWKKHLLICILLIVIGILILHLWHPGIIKAFFGHIHDSLAHLYEDMGNIIKYIQDKH